MMHSIRQKISKVIDHRRDAKNAEIESYWSDFLIPSLTGQVSKIRPNHQASASKITDEYDFKLQTLSGGWVFLLSGVPVPRFSAGSTESKKIETSASSAPLR